MSATIIIILVFVALIALAGVIISWLWQGRKIDKAVIKASFNREETLKKAIVQRDELLTKLQEADNAANKQKDKLASGSASDRVGNSVNVLHDIAKPGT